MREGIPEETRHPERHIHPRPPELAEGNDFDAFDTAGLGRPDRAHAEQCERLGDVVPAGAHDGSTPHDDRHRARSSPSSERWRSHRRAASASPTSIEMREGTALGSSGVEVAARREHVRHAPAGRPGRSRRHEGAVEGAEHRADLTSRGAERRHEPLADPCQRRAHRLAVRLGGIGGERSWRFLGVGADNRRRCVRFRGYMPHNLTHLGLAQAARRPLGRRQGCHERPARRLDTVDLRPTGGLERDAEQPSHAGPKRRHRALPQASERQQEIDEGLAGRRAPEDVQASRIWASFSSQR